MTKLTRVVLFAALVAGLLWLLAELRHFEGMWM